PADPPHLVAGDGGLFGKAGFDGGGEGAGVAGLAVGPQVGHRFVAALAEDDTAGEGHVAVAATPDVQDGRLPDLLPQAKVEGVNHEGVAAVGPSEPDLDMHGHCSFLAAFFAALLQGTHRPSEWNRSLVATLRLAPQSRQTRSRIRFVPHPSEA